MVSSKSKGKSIVGSSRTRRAAPKPRASGNRPDYKLKIFRKLTEAQKEAGVSSNASVIGAAWADDDRTHITIILSPGTVLDWRDVGKSGDHGLSLWPSEDDGGDVIPF
jgi:hypothetical protein